MKLWQKAWDSLGCNSGFYSAKSYPDADNIIGGPSLYLASKESPLPSQHQMDYPA